MNYLIELWSAKPAWTALAPDTQKVFLDDVLAHVAPLLGGGMKEVVSGFATSDVPNSLPTQYFSIWGAPDPEVLLKFCNALRDFGWFTYFDQLNIAGVGSTLSDVLADHIVGAA
jgi:hypothetical protein